MARGSNLKESKRLSKNAFHTSDIKKVNSIGNEQFSSRQRHERPFYQIGVNYAGSYMMRDASGRERVNYKVCNCAYL